MDKAKKRHLEKKGWKVGSVQEFLALTPEESTHIELKLDVSKNVKKRRDLAQVIGCK